MALEQHMAEVNRLVREQAAEVGAGDALQMSATLRLPIPSDPNGTPYGVHADWNTPGGACACTLAISTALPAHEAAHQVVEALRRASVTAKADEPEAPKGKAKGKGNPEPDQKPGPAAPSNPL